MNNNIVTQLRNECQCTDDCRAVDDPCISMRAADEIERLQADRDRWFKIADAMAGCLDSSTDASDALREYERAVRGE